VALGFGSLPSSGRSDAASHELAAFAASLPDSDSSQLLGIFVPHVFSLPVVAQPEDSPTFVSAQPGTITEFSSASTYGSIGLLAHNYLAGAQFSLLQEGGPLYLVYSGGEIHTFVITQTLEFQALQPDSPYSEFVDLESDARLSASDLFKRIYRRSGAVILQTCIEAHGDDSWGRLFVVAEPI
jgi:hypothetical protein